MPTWDAGVVSIAGTVGAFLAGVSGSVHCVLMCGPLACAGLGGSSQRLGPVLSYQVSRVLAYTGVGLLLGFAGRGVVSLLAADIQPYLPWVMAAALVATALELGRHLRPLPGFAQLVRLGTRAAGASAKLTPPVRSAIFGAMTPLLPCGLLWGVMLAAVATGSALGGAGVMGGFALGGVPALALTQLQAKWLAGQPRLGRYVRRTVPLLAAAVLIWRAVHAPGEAQDTPSCH